ncbi:MAG: hypothetical protein JWL65_1392 [Gammaproteobacteria bacterium]|nr:hypothetical protein [Gammaproteobacteria bacterium]
MIDVQLATDCGLYQPLARRDLSACPLRVGSVISPTGIELALSANCGRLGSLTACRIADVGNGDHAMLQVATLLDH